MAVYSGRLEDIMTKILKTAKTTTETYGLGTGDLAGENIVDF
ncbi:NADP oxidoreductase [Streptococcus sp. FDAARGOS_256]|nr:MULTISPECIES: NADP oxidoreductase [Streptococcus]MCB7106408.1 NADP oxidoreductase [Streptococcus oralis]MCQ5168156.1 NADP oxidoreductase [Streptococcus oralis]PNK71137.1 NADP oxidoreductase [Streptococcus sp. FDAARGOS_256]